MTTEGDNVDASLLKSLPVPEATTGHGHIFRQKSFGKVTYCHHCCELFWGILSQGYVCEICNFTCHEKCVKTVASYCSGVALQLIKNPVAHCWSEVTNIKRKFCCVCRKRTDDSLSVECEVCEYYVHVECLELAVSDCKEAATYLPSLEPDVQVQHHHFREGNLPTGARCAVCRKSCCSSEFLSGMRCEWCQVTAHAICYRQIKQECDFATMRSIMLPPNCLTVPRTEIDMVELLTISGVRRSNKERSELNPTKPITDEGSSAGGSDESAKDKEDVESIRVFDGTGSLRRNAYKTILITKTATLMQLKELILRTFHIIQDNPDNYRLTQVVSEDGQEEPLTDPQPVRLVQCHRECGRKMQIVVRYCGLHHDQTTMKIYGGWLRIPVTFCEITITGQSTIADCIRGALGRFGIASSSSSLYNLVEVSLDRGIVERTFADDQILLTIIQEMRTESLRKFQNTRFYLQEKEDPHEANALFVGNLPSSLSQKAYESILLKLLGQDERPFTAIGTIYYEYGSLVIKFNTPKAATKACQKLKNQTYDNKPLLVLYLPYIQPHMIPESCSPLMVLVNVKSGGCQGQELMRSFRKLLNPFQVFDVLNGGPLVALYVFRNIPKYKILVCGGDGTVGWVLQCLDIVGQDSVCSSPPCGVLPLGTGNDLARVLRWGPGHTGQEDSLQLLKDTIDAEEISLDRWTAVFHCDEQTTSGSGSQVDSALQDDTSMVIMNNYFGIGIDAEVCLAFHDAREEKPEKFQSRLHNKAFYGKVGLKKLLNRQLDCKNLQKKVRLEVDGRHIELPPIEGIIVLNIMSWGSGAKPWGKDEDPEDTGFVKPTHHDGLLEVVGVTGVVHLGQMQAGLGCGIKLAQGGHIRIDTNQVLPVQVDGEPRTHPPGRITILKSALKATMLKKSKIKRRPTDPHLPQRQATAPPLGGTGVPCTLPGVAVPGQSGANAQAWAEKMGYGDVYIGTPQSPLTHTASAPVPGDMPTTTTEEAPAHDDVIL